MCITSRSGILAARAVQREIGRGFLASHVLEDTLHDAVACGREPAHTKNVMGGGCRGGGRVCMYLLHSTIAVRIMFDRENVGDFRLQDTLERELGKQTAVEMFVR